MQTSLEYDANPLVVFISITLVNRGDIMYIIAKIYFVNFTCEHRVSAAEDRPMMRERPVTAEN